MPLFGQIGMKYFLVRYLQHDLVFLTIFKFLVYYHWLIEAEQPKKVEHGQHVGTVSKNDEVE